MESGNVKTDAIPQHSVDRDSISSSSIGVTLEKEDAKKFWKLRLEGMTVVVLSVVVVTLAITIALVLSVFIGAPQVASHGSVVSVSDYCNKYGIEVMEKYDATAVDAAVATALCLTVVRPDLASLAGCGTMLVKDRSTQQSWLYDFQCAAPSNPVAVDPANPASLVGVPGFIKGLQMAHSNFGKRTWNSLFTGAFAAARNGFTPDIDLMTQAQSIKSEQGTNAGPIIDAFATKISHYQPPAQLLRTLNTLSADSGAFFYTAQAYPSTFGGRLINYLNTNGRATWTESDLTSYMVLQPSPISTKFAGFNIEAFPTPSSGGPYLINLLGNLDLKDKLSPLDPDSLAHEEPNATSIMLHRLIEFAKLAESSASKLGDPLDNTISELVLKQQSGMFLDKNRKAEVDMVKDDAVSIPNATMERPANLQIGDTSIIASDSDHLTVVLTSYLGAPFGTGQVVPESGVHLNAALKLFSASSSVPSNQIFNTLAGRRRPLVPVSPVYVSTVHRKCGVRFGLGTSGGYWGMLDAAEVITNGALFLRGSTCLPSTLSDPHADTTAALSNQPPSVQKVGSKQSGYAPAVEYECINGQTAIDLSRLHTGSLQPASGQAANGRTVIYEAGLPDSLVANLKALGHPLEEKKKQCLARSCWVGWVERV